MHIMIKGNWTFAIEGRPNPFTFSTDYWLCVENGKELRKIALFINKEDMALFTRTLDLAKMASHEHGRNGI
jgi:hypothetical protein